MDAFDFYTYQFYQKSLVDVVLLEETLPSCFKILESQNNQCDDIITLEFKRTDCISLKNLLFFIRSEYFYLLHGQIFILISEILSLFEKEQYRYQVPSMDRIFLVFDLQNRFLYKNRQTVQYKLFYCFPLKMQTQKEVVQNNLQKIVSKLLEVCEILETQIYFFKSRKPYKKFLATLKADYEQFTQELKQYVSSAENINVNSQTDYNLDPLFFPFNDEQYYDSISPQKIGMQFFKQIKNYKSESFWKHQLFGLKIECELQKEFQSQQIFDGKIKYFHDVDFLNLIDLFTRQQYKTLFFSLFEQIISEQTKLHNTLNLENFSDKIIKNDEVLHLIEQTLSQWFMKNGFFNSIKQYLDGRNQILQNHEILEKELKPIVEAFHARIIQLQICEIANSII